MGFEYYPYWFPETNGAIMRDIDGQQILKVVHSANITNIYGADSSGDKLRFYPNNANAYPLFFLEGNSHIYARCASGASLYLGHGVYNSFQLNYASNVSSLKGGTTAADDLQLFANGVDTLSYILIEGQGNTTFRQQYSNAEFAFEGATVRYMTLKYAAAVTELCGGWTANDIFKLRGNSSDNAPDVYLDGGKANVAINATSISEHYDLALLGDGVLCIKESATPTADTNYGKIYCKNDDKLYFQDGAGNEHEVAFV